MGVTRPKILWQSASHATRRRLNVRQRHDVGNTGGNQNLRSGNSSRGKLLLGKGTLTSPPPPIVPPEGIKPERICKAMGFLALHECRLVPCICAPVWVMWDCWHIYWSRASQRLRGQSSASFGPWHCGLHIRWPLP